MHTMVVIVQSTLDRQCIYRAQYTMLVSYVAYIRISHQSETIQWMMLSSIGSGPHHGYLSCHMCARTHTHMSNTYTLTYIIAIHVRALANPQKCIQCVCVCVCVRACVRACVRVCVCKKYILAQGQVWCWCSEDSINQSLGT